MSKLSKDPLKITTCKNWDLIAPYWYRKAMKMNKKSSPLPALIANLINSFAVYYFTFDTEEMNLTRHDQIGVRFMFNCLMGYKNNFGNGCILADVFELDKRLQVLSLINTLLTQGSDGTPVCNNGMIICDSDQLPVWENLIKKKIGENILRPFVCKGGFTEINFTVTNFNNEESETRVILIVSYQTLKFYRHLITVKSVGFMVFEDGIRLDDYTNELYGKCMSLPANKRLLLTYENVIQIKETDMKSAYIRQFSLANFVNPKIWKSFSHFLEDRLVNKHLIKLQSFVLRRTKSQNN